MTLNERNVILEVPIFQFHDYGRKGTLCFVLVNQRNGRINSFKSFTLDFGTNKPWNRLCLLQWMNLVFTKWRAKGRNKVRVEDRPVLEGHVFRILKLLLLQGFAGIMSFQLIFLFHVFSMQILEDVIQRWGGTTNEVYTAGRYFIGPWNTFVFGPHGSVVKCWHTNWR